MGGGGFSVVLLRARLESSASFLRWAKCVLVSKMDPRFSQCEIKCSKSPLTVLSGVNKATVSACSDLLFWHSGLRAPQQASAKSASSDRT